MTVPIISPLDAVILGIVEGLTEFLPVSSTGHLILTAHWLGLDPEDIGLKAFMIVIQAGALLAVIGIYLRSVKSMLLGLAGRDPEGLRLLTQLIVAFLPAAIIGLTIGGRIKDLLFSPGPVISALALGGIVMIVVERLRRRRAAPLGQPPGGRSLAEMTLGLALMIGCAQVVAMWPGTSRSMVTIVAALILGFSPRAAAEFSFLLALPTLGAATAYDMLKDGGAIIEASGWSGLAIGFVVSCIVAFVAVKTFLAYLTRHGMEVFGWYRLALAAAVALVML